MSLVIENRTNIRVNKTDILQATKKILNALDMKKYSLNIIFVTDSEIRGLNKQYRKIDKATDVLSFSLLEGAFSNINPCYEMGDIVVSLETAKHRITKKNNLTKEIYKLIIHGFLHIAGFDHQLKNDTDKMRSMEKKLINLIEQG